VSYRELVIFVEGADDEMFFQAVLKPRLLRRTYDWVTLWRYAERRPEKTRAFLRSVKARGADYLLAADINGAPCVTARKDRLLGRLPELSRDRIAVIVSEIESWYLAGIGSAAAKGLRVPVHSRTDAVTKERFDRLIPRSSRSRVDFMAELLRFFSLGVAKRKNRSFEYFLRKYDG